METSYYTTFIMKNKKLKISGLKFIFSCFLFFVLTNLMFGSNDVNKNTKKETPKNNYNFIELFLTTNKKTPTSDFSFSTNNACSNENIQFTAAGNSTLSYLWDFGDGTTSTIANPTHQFEALGCGTSTFNVTLTTTDAGGLSSSTTKPINVLEKPALSFSDLDFNNFDNCGSGFSSNSEYTITVVNNTNASCVTSGSYEIDWGDGNTTTSATFPATHTYTELGTFNMNISATSSNGCSNEVSYLVKNINNPAGGFVSPGNTSNLCLPTDALNFGISNWGTNSLDTEYFVSFGDGTVVGYTQAQMVTSSYYDSVNPGNSAVFPTPHSYTTSSCDTETGEFVARLSIQNACESTTFTISNISTLGTSEASFEGPPLSCINTPITFENTSNIRENGDCTKSANFLWDFGDGTIVNDNGTDESSDQIHQYTSPGTYTVSLTITSRCGSDTFTQEICIEPEITPLFTVNTNEGCIPLNIQTTNTTNEAGLCSDATYDWAVNYEADNCGTTSNWEFTNGTSSTSENPEFIFNTSGKYTLTQTITTSCGSETSTQIIDVKKPPTVTINPIENLCGTGSINPSATINNCTSNTSGISYNWTFIGGTPASANTLDPGNISYNALGNYTATLEITNECGVSNTATQTFEVLELSELTNTNLTQEICSNQTTVETPFSSTNTNTTFSWTAIATNGITGFSASGTGTSLPAETLINPSNTTGTVTYTVTPTLNSCAGTAVNFSVTVNPSPIISTQPADANICLNTPANLLEVSYINSTGTPTYQWYANTTDTNSGGTLISGATSSTYTPTTSSIGTTYYYVEISFGAGGCDFIISDTAEINVGAQLTIDLPVNLNQLICVGGTANELNISYTNGIGTPTYQWYSNTTNTTTGGTLIAGATNSNYTPPTFTSAGTFYYYAEVSVDGLGCNTASSNIYEIEVLNTPTISLQPITSQELCVNAVPEDLTVLAINGTTSTKTYQWFLNTTNSNVGGTPITGATNTTYTPNTTTVGTFYYYVLVSQAEAGCSVRSDVSELIINQPPTITQQPINSVFCLNETALPLAIEFTNGIGTATYQWFTNTTSSTTGGTPISGETLSTFTPNTDTVGSTFYYVEIYFSSGGCSLIASTIAEVVVNQNPNILDDTISIYSGETFNYNPANVAGNLVPSSTQYTWSSPTINPIGSITGGSAVTNLQNSISQTLENSTLLPASATYTVTPSAENCLGTPFLLTVTINPSITTNVTTTNSSCFNADNGTITTAIIGGIPFTSGSPYLVSWTGPNGFTANTTTITNLEAGIYTLRVEDMTGFFITEEYTITQPNELVIVKDLEKNISCNTGADGEIEITVTGGTLPYNYTWSTINGSGINTSTKNQNNLTAGTYTVLVTDANNCTVTTNVTLSEPTAISVAPITIQNILCFGNATGSISIDVNGGTPLETTAGVFDYTYSWTGPGGFTSNQKNITNILAGEYSVAVTDANNCTTNSNFNITQPTEVMVAVTKTDVTCHNNNDGSITVDITGGVLPYEISWNNLASGTTLNDLAAGTYTVTVVDGNNCTKVVAIEIEQPVFFIDPVVTPISCNGAADASIRLNLTGGVTPINITWDDDANAGLQRNNLAAGTYRAVITDSNLFQCPIEETFIITNPAVLVVTEVITDATDCALPNSGSINLTVSGGTAPYIFSWNSGQTSEDLTNIPGGDYTVEITDANGCSFTKQYSVFRQEPLAISLLETQITECELQSVMQETKAIVTGGFPPYNYAWSSGVVPMNDNSSMTTFQNGAYSLTVTDANNCTSTASFSVNLPTIGTPLFSYASFAQNSFNILSIEDPIQFTNLSTSPYENITWTFGDGSEKVSTENPVHTYDETGTFNVVLAVEYANGCIQTYEQEIEITKGYSLVNPTGFTPNNDGFNDFFRPSFRGLIQIEMKIFDTWGTLIYFEENTTNLKGWDGFINDKPAENGNYLLLVKGTTFYNKTITTNTPLTLIR